MNRRGTWWAFGGGLLFIVLVTAPLVLLARSSPQRELGQAFANTAKAISTGAPAMFSLRAPLGSSSSSVKVTFASSSAGGDGELQIVLPNGDGTVQLNARLVTSSDGTVYVQAYDLQKTLDPLEKTSPVVASYSDAARPLTKLLDNKWVKVEPTDIEALARSMKQVQCESMLGSLQPGELATKNIESAYKSHQFLAVTKKIKGGPADSVGYSVELQAAELSDFSGALGADSKLGMVARECARHIAQTGKKPEYSIWISKKTKTITRIESGNSGTVFELQTGVARKPQAQAPSEALPFSSLQEVVEKITPIGTSSLKKL